MYKPHTVAITYSNNYINKVSPADHILNILFTGTETMGQSNIYINVVDSVFQ